MMTFDDIKTLQQNGFTWDEIRTLMRAENQTPAPDPDKPDPTPTPDPDKPDPTPAPINPIESETNKLLKALGLRIESLTGAIQRHNVNNLDNPGNGPETTENVLARIINPHIGEKEE